MPNYDWRLAFWNDLKGAINATCPELTHLYKVINVERLNWSNEIESKRLVPPWCVVQLPSIQRVIGWGCANQVYQPVPTVYYITEYTTGVVDALAVSLENLEAYLMSHEFSFTLEEETFAQDLSEENVVNASMLQADMLYVAGSLSFSCITGYANVRS